MIGVNTSIFGIPCSLFDIHLFNIIFSTENHGFIFIILFILFPLILRLSTLTTSLQPKHLPYETKTKSCTPDDPGNNYRILSTFLITYRAAITR